MNFIAEENLYYEKERESIILNSGGGHGHVAGRLIRLRK